MGKSPGGRPGRSRRPREPNSKEKQKSAEAAMFYVIATKRKLLLKDRRGEGGFMMKQRPPGGPGKDLYAVCFIIKMQMQIACKCKM